MKGCTNVRAAASTKKTSTQPYKTHSLLCETFIAPASHCISPFSKGFPVCTFPPFHTFLALIQPLLHPESSLNLFIFNQKISMRIIPHNLKLQMFFNLTVILHFQDQGKTFFSGMSLFGSLPSRNSKVFSSGLAK